MLALARPVLGVVAVLALFLVVGLAIRWAMRAGQRLSRSERQMGDWDRW